MRAYGEKDYLIEEIVQSSLYDIKDNGTVLTRIAKSGKLASIWRTAGYINNRGYRCVKYRNTQIQVHRIIYRKFLGELDTSKQINHKDGIKHNNSVSNLELVSPGYNQHHAYRILNRSPVKNGMGLAQAEKIREDYATGGFSLKEISIKYGIAKSTASYIINNRTWKQGP